MNFLKDIAVGVDNMINGTPEYRWQNRMDTRASNLEPFLHDRLEQFKAENTGHTYSVKYADPSIMAQDAYGRPLDCRNLVQIVLDSPDKFYTGIVMDLSHPMYASDMYINMILDQLEEMINTHRKRKRHAIF